MSVEKEYIKLVNLKLENAHHKLDYVRKLLKELFELPFEVTHLNTEQRCIFENICEDLKAFVKE